MNKLLLSILLLTPVFAMADNLRTGFYVYNNLADPACSNGAQFAVDVANVPLTTLVATEKGQLLVKDRWLNDEFTPYNQAKKTLATIGLTSAQILAANVRIQAFHEWENGKIAQLNTQSVCMRVSLPLTSGDK